ncbi:MAG: ribosome biogenesis GTP-binding protein YihA/YsxC [Simkaniaceae bacterium]|nr:ribosome biogenesis GTP-binding protein YihA/YsxC [Simkaniaceae bacterium]
MEAIYLFSSLDHDKIPPARAEHGNILPEIAIAGRSNVGKSSLLNHLINRKKLAFVSATPGKTQSINFFNIDDKFCLVDLPGYGFAQVPEKLRKKWGLAIDGYLREREHLTALLLLLDIRRTLNADDLNMIRWAAHRGKKFAIVFTKCDKAKSNERTRQIAKNKRIIKEELGIETIPTLPYSIKDRTCRTRMMQTIEKLLEEE